MMYDLTWINDYEFKIENREHGVIHVQLNDEIQLTITLDDVRFCFS